jgi:hypothetical protein
VGLVLRAPLVLYSRTDHFSSSMAPLNLLFVRAPALSRQGRAIICGNWNVLFSVENESDVYGPGGDVVGRAFLETINLSSLFGCNGAGARLFVFDWITCGRLRTSSKLCLKSQYLTVLSQMRF